MAEPVAAPVPAAAAANKNKYAIIGGSGVHVSGAVEFSWGTPFGSVTGLSFLDEGQNVIFVNRHLCTNIGTDGHATYAPPHEVNFHAMLWALKDLGVQGVCAIGSTGTLRPESVPVGSIVMPDDFLCTCPTAVTYWPHEKMGLFNPDPTKGQIGRIHFAPAIVEDTSWVSFRGWVRDALCEQLDPLNQILAADASSSAAECIPFAKGQSPESWPALSVEPPPAVPEMVYVQTTGPRFETRAEVQSYVSRGHIVGMTCATEWTLASELMLPYALVVAVDNCCNGLSVHPGGALQEYLDHKVAISSITSSMVQHLCSKLVERAEMDCLRRTCAGE